MIKKFLVSLVVVLCMGCSVSAETIKMYSLDTLNIRKEPEGKVIGSYSKGDEVIVEEYGDEWSKTDKGYVASAYLGETKNGLRDVGVAYRELETGLSFTEKVKVFKEEYNVADYKYRDFNTFLTISENKVRNAGTYLLSHVIIKSPKDILGYYSFNNFGGEGQKASDAFNSIEDSLLIINGSYYDIDTGTPASVSINIYGGDLVTDGLTTGYEICLLEDGSFMSPDVGISGSDLLDMGVSYVWASDEGVLIRGGEKLEVESSGFDYVYPRTAVAMVEPGEYYFITSSGEGNSNGLSIRDVQEIFSQLGCTYARTLDSGGSVTLVYDGKVLNETSTGNERKVSDFMVLLK